MLAFAAVAAIATAGGRAYAQAADPNSASNPYHLDSWAPQLPAGRKLGAAIGIAIDKDGRSIWVYERCGENTCEGSNLDPIMKFDPSGKMVANFGGGKVNWPHGFSVDRDNNVWVSDGRAGGGKGHDVIKFSPDGKVLMTLGKAGVKGNPPEALSEPNDVVTDPGNGDVYVAESHTDVTDPNLIGRISVFDKNGKFLRTIGKAGTGPGEFRTPHALEFDSMGRLVVADRHNHRVQILTKDGRFVREYDDFGRSSGLAIDRNDTIYTTDSESTERVHPGWQRGVRIGSLKDGKVTTFIPAHKTDAPEGAMGEGIAIDSAGNIYTAEANLRGVTKYVKQ